MRQTGGGSQANIKNMRHLIEYRARGHFVTADYKKMRGEFFLTSHFHAF